MYKTFENLNALLECVEEDKVMTGINSAITGRFPVRFVMFDNFKDCYDFVDRLTGNGVELQSVDYWLDPQYPDLMITYSKLADKICSFVQNKEDVDVVIAPFSELARFYNNNSDIEFDSLISTIKAIEATRQGYKNKQRAYIPIVGLEAKMSKFYNDSQIIVWYYKNPVPQQNYRLILSKNTTYGVNGLEHSYSIVNTVSEWLRLWRDQKMKHNIICTSSSIFAYSEYAQPDNAFDFITCTSVFDFLTQGLVLDLKFLSDKEGTKIYWKELAKEIDIEAFNFEAFFNAKFDIHALANFDVFVRIWFENPLPFDRWLLSSYYLEKFCSKGYVCEAIKNMNGYTNADLTQTIALTIFDLEKPDDFINERSAILSYISKEKVVLPENIQNKLIEKINQVADKFGYTTALRYISLVTSAEKNLLINWISRSLILKENIRTLYPQLYYYLERSFGINDVENQWILNYFDAYKIAKVSNQYTTAIKDFINEKNCNAIKFNSWYQNFSTPRTILNGRKDIDTFFWIDGLGIDWLPYIQYVIGLRKNDNFFLNEVYISRAEIPTKTENNKKSLLLLANDNLPKEGDLDSVSHKIRPYPQYLIEDMDRVAEIINSILDNNPEKKIAIVSDHGISYLPQLCPGLNLPGFESDHGGRIATVGKKPTVDNRYIILEDNKTVCALQHNSLCAKIPLGSGCHGGCTPEEVLVPILIISSHPNATNWIANIRDFEVSASNPIVKFSIRGLAYNDIPVVEYNNVRYDLITQPGEIYVTPNLPLSHDAQCIRLIIGDKYQDFKLKLDLGTEEEDLFNF